MYQFTYEVKVGGGGICDSQDSQIKACQDPGSSYVDNQVFRMQFAKCRDVSTSYNKRKYVKLLHNFSNMPVVSMMSMKGVKAYVRRSSGDFCRLLITFATSLDPDKGCLCRF